MTPDPDTARKVAEIVKRFPFMAPIRAVTERHQGQTIEWPTTWVDRLNQRAREAMQ